jgi:tRNA A-37 threonylcarbamoyl transferase component Bud32/Flp pilus assembly protein TadD
MVCSCCQTEHDESDLEACPTCGAALHSENEEATRITAPPESPESGMATGEARGFERTSSSAPPGNAVPGSSVAGWSAVNSGDLSGAVCLLRGTVLGDRYEILGSLGEGGMGAVYKARDLEVNRVVAIKIIRAELASDPLILERFKQELVLARQVTHRNVVRIYDLGVASGMRFISMEYIEGRELSDVIRQRGKCQPKDAAEIMLQVCRGLEAAHAQGVIHRDLKPQNVMVDASGRAAVMDFGIAHSGIPSDGDKNETAAISEGGLTHVGALLGTPRYMSPEQAQGRAVDARSDIYTVGLIFYELLAGKLPFSAPTVKELLRNRGNEPVTPLTAVDPAIPKRLNEIVLKCLESTPARRYQSVTELIADLEIWLGIRSVYSGKKLKGWAAATSAVALLAIVAVSFLLRDRAAVNATRAHKPVTVLVTDFRNTTRQPVLSGVAEPMFQVALEGASFISSFNRGQAEKIGAQINPGATRLDQRLGRLVALREGVGVVVGGAIEQQGSALRLSTTTTDAAGKLLLSDDVKFDGPNDLPKAVDKIASRIRRVLGDASHTSENGAAETFTSGNLESAHLYATAQQLQWDGKWSDAIAAYKKAVSIDPKMSRAYAGLAAMLANLGERQQSAHYYQLALANLDRESEREKYRTRGGYYLMMRDYKKAAEQFGQLVKQYPVDTAGLANLALADFYARNMTAALVEGRKAIQIYPHNILQRNNVGLYAMYAGEFDAAIKESETIIKMNPSFEKAYLCLGISELQKGSVDAATAAYEKLSTLSDWGASQGSLALADLAMYQGRFKDAAKLLEAGVSTDKAQKKLGPAAVKLIALAEAQMQRRERALAVRTAAEAMAASDDESVLYSAAALDIQAGDVTAATRIAQKLDDQFEPEPRALGKIIQGEIELHTGKLHDAVSSLEDSQKLADTWLGRLDLGRAYLAAKLYPDAENEFDVCLKRRGEASALFLDDEPTVRYVPEIYYYLGVAKTGLGDANATADLKTFIAIKQASEADPMVADATRRLKAQ